MARFFSSFLIIAVYSLLGIGLFAGLFWLGMAQQTVSILMYRGLLLAVIAAGLHILCLVALRSVLPAMTDAVAIGAVSLSLAMNVMFLIVFPVTIDRSVTVYLLGQLEKAPHGLSASDLRSQLVNQYVDEYQAVQRRMREQIISANVIEKDGRYLLSDQGRSFLSFSRVVGRVFGADLRFIQDSDRLLSASNQEGAP